MQKCRETGGERTATRRMDEGVPTYREQEERRPGARVPPASMLGPKVVGKCGGGVSGPPPSPSGRRRAEGDKDSPLSSVSVSVGSGRFRRLNLNARVAPGVAAGGCCSIVSTGTAVGILWIRREGSSSHSGRASAGGKVSRPEVPRTSCIQSLIWAGLRPPAAACARGRFIRKKNDLLLKLNDVRTHEKYCLHKSDALQVVYARRNLLIYYS
jgi:hypothetical protein